MKAGAHNGGPAVEADGLGKSYGAVRALRGVDLAVPYGTVRGLLGPNGAGKTTLVRLLATLLRPSAGRAEVGGFDIVREAGRVREVIGLAGQYAAIDENLTGRENLAMVGRLHHMGRGAAARRADELLDRFSLAEAGGRMARGYSGGMRRRLDLAASMVAEPRILFLDEPTTGLDPRSRLDLWEVIGELVADGTTVLLTTQHMEEADHLADVITVIDRGSVIAEGTPEQLKARCGGTRLSIRVADPARTPDARSVAATVGLDEPTADGAGGRVEVTVESDAGPLAQAVRLLDAAGVAISDISLRQPTLDDVFLALTGQRAEGDEQEAAP